MKFQNEIDIGFEKAQNDIKLITKRPTDEELLELYGLFKQSTKGNIDIPKPSYFNFSKDDLKWNSWKSCENLNANTAKKLYISKVTLLENKYK